MLLVFADFLVRGAVGLARLAGMSPLIIGLTVVAFGTSAPEFVTSLAASLGGAPAIAIGTIIGSNIANLLLILGVAAAMRPLACSRQLIGRDGVVVPGAAVLLVAIASSGEISRPAGAALFVGLAAYVALTYRYERRAPTRSSPHAAGAEGVDDTPKRGRVAGLVPAAGLAGIIVGAELLVGGAVDLARNIGVSEAVIGLTLIAVGTSLPELATAIMATWRRHGDVAIGNVLGSNIFNTLAIAGGVSVVSPIAVPAEIVRFDLWCMLASSLLVLPLMISDRSISRREGGALLALYAGYLGWQVAAAPAIAT